MPRSYSRPSLAPWNITYYSSLVSHCLSHGDEWMRWQLMEEENKGKAARWRWHPAPTAHISDLFSLQLNRQLLSIHFDIQFHLIYCIDGSVNSVWPLSYQFPVLMENGRQLQSHPFQLFTLTSHQLLWRATAEVCPLVFVNVLFGSAGKEPTVKQSRKRNHTSTTVFFSLTAFFFFLQLSSQHSTLIKIWSMCTPSWTSAFSPGWRWVSIDSYSPLAPDQWATELDTSEKKPGRWWGGSEWLGPNGASIDARPEVVLGSWMLLTMAALIAILVIFDGNRNSVRMHLLGF